MWHQEVAGMKKAQMLAYMHDLADNALEEKRKTLVIKQTDLYPETIRYLTLVQIDNLWIQQLEVSPPSSSVPINRKVKPCVAAHHRLWTS
jgi:preprotein translocase subunit SecA